MTLPKYYLALIHKEKDSEYGVSFPDFPGCVTAGKTLEEAKAMAREALELHIEGMLKDGEALPEPTGVVGFDKPAKLVEEAHALCGILVIPKFCARR